MLEKTTLWFSLKTRATKFLIIHNMNSQASSPPLYYHHKRKLAGLDSKNFFKPAAHFSLLLLSYLLGYLSAPSVKPKPANSNSRIVQNTAPAAASDVPGHYRFSPECGGPVTPELVRGTILDRVFNGTSPWENFPPPHVGSLLRQRRVKGWGSKGAVFENLITRVKPKTIIEIGTFLGASALHMVEVTRQLGLETQILCLDDFRGWPGFRDRFRDIAMVNGDVLLLQQFMQNVVNANATLSVSFMPFSTGSGLEKLCEWGVFADLIEVDAGHDFHSAWSDINRAYKLLRPGGVMFGHDYFLAADNKGVRRAVDLFARVKNLRVKVDGQHWVLAPRSL